MHPFLRIGRRQFLRNSALGLGAAPMLAGVSSAESTRPEPKSTGPATKSNGVMMHTAFGAKDPVWIVRDPNAGFQEQWASRELARGLRNLGFAREPVQAVAGCTELPPSALAFTLSSNRQVFRHAEAYDITPGHNSGKGASVHITGATPQAVLYAVFDFLERQGAFFGLDGEVYPLEPTRSLKLPVAGQPWHGQPRFSTRGLVPWPDFLNCVTVYNREDWRAYLEAMVRMRFNTLGVHVYSTQNQWAESFLSFEYAGAGHIAYTDTTATPRWSYVPERTSRYGMGGGDFFAGEVFGAEATTQAHEYLGSAGDGAAAVGRSLSICEAIGHPHGSGI